MARIDIAVNDFAVYEDATELLGQADLTLPDIQYITQEISGAGISGNIAATITGHVQAMSMTINFRTPTESAINLNKPGIHKIDARGCIDEMDLVTGQKVKVPVKYLMSVEATAFNPGKLAPAATADTNGTYSVWAISMYRDGKKAFEVNPGAYIFEVDGVDYLADVRKALGK